MGKIVELYGGRMSAVHYGLCKQRCVENASELVAASELEYISSLCDQNGLNGSIENIYNWEQQLIIMIIGFTAVKIHVNKQWDIFFHVVPKYATLVSLRVSFMIHASFPVLLFKLILLIGHCIQQVCCSLNLWWALCCFYNNPKSTLNTAWSEPLILYSSFIINLQSSGSQSWSVWFPSLGTNCHLCAIITHFSNKN